MSALERIARCGVVPVVVVDRADRVPALGAALVAAGLPCIEITMRTPEAIPAIELLTQAVPELLVGVGTVRTVTQAESAVDAGARFVVSPGLDDQIVEWCLANRTAVLPGVMTPTEVQRAARTGVDTVKFFPAEIAGGVRALEAMSGVYPDVGFVPTGGIDASNLADYLRIRGVLACGGSWIAPRSQLAEGDLATIERLAAEAVQIVARARSGGASP